VALKFAVLSKLADALSSSRKGDQSSDRTQPDADKLLPKREIKTRSANGFLQTTATLRPKERAVFDYLQKNFGLGR
jgi:hypothetical protein